MSNFWQKLPKPFTVLAPMDDVTDNVFRQVVLFAGRPNVFFTEFTSADGLIHGANGIPLRKLNFTKNQHPIVAQIWGTDAENLGRAAKIVRGLGFDGVDINMGCPVREVIKKGAGAGLIGNYENAEKIISEVKNGADGMPVSVKTRLGINTNIAKDWTSFLLKQNISAITVHLRIAKQMSKGDADWDQMKMIVKMRDELSPKTLIIGNGDVKSLAEVQALHNKYKVDGVMIGRGIFDNPWIFLKDQREHSKKEYINLIKFHIKLFEETWGDQKHFAILKKFFKMYVKDFKGANKFRQELMNTKSLEEIKQLIDKAI